MLISRPSCLQSTRRRLLVCLALTAASSASCKSPPPSPPVADVPPVIQFDTATPVTEQTWVAGDSLVAHSNSWSRRLGASYRNLGLSGSAWVSESTESIPTRVRRILASDGAPKRVVLTGGINDESHQANIELMKAAITSLVSTLEAQGVEVRIVPPPGRNGSHPTPILGAWRDFLLAAFPSQVIDCGVSLGWPTPNPSLFTDFAHPTTEGHRIMATCVRSSGQLADLD